MHRASGILLHPTSLPGRYGIGDLGSTAYEFVDFLARSHQQLWQVLPLGPTGYGNSPYLCYSALAGNPLLISPEILMREGWLRAEDLEGFPHFPDDRVDYDLIAPYRYALFKTASLRFKSEATPEQWQAFEQFCQQKAGWLEDYSLFMALKDTDQDSTWNQWEPAIAQRLPTALEQARQQLVDGIYFHKYLQFEFFRQWIALKTYANDRNIQIIGDLPIYVAHDSADVWANPQNFCLDRETGEVALMAGVPPDYFSETGQLWGNPVYDWQVLQDSQFAWWIDRFQGMLALTDWIRIDHFRGFQAYWAVPHGETTAIHGEWIEAPGEAFFRTVKQVLGDLPILAEDLGDISPDVIALRDQFGLPGMKVLQFAFESDSANPFLPYNHSQNFVVYTGTHDNNTTLGWFNQDLSDYGKQRLTRYLGGLSSMGVNWDLIRLAFSSVANWAIVPLQDVIGLDQSARMNRPGTPSGNWEWRFRADMLTDEICDRLRDFTDIYGRMAVRDSSLTDQDE
ncbi:MAG: 4-alpha-glucanotransferase [Cyanobacteria bacterium]|nr:4-alpha-glucanotransferase [Cyanobacteriota bacterium]MDW8201753.1 4-alpha-glucanotransferase [Cyanobacteriota bacterium SKYGB_h_bin112]